MATTFRELAEVANSINQQARALLGISNALLRQLSPLVEQEEDEQGGKEPERRLPRVLGEQVNQEGKRG